MSSKSDPPPKPRRRKPRRETTGQVVSILPDGLSKVLAEDGGEYVTRGGIPGQRVRIGVLRGKKHRIRKAVLLEVLERSPQEVDARCPHAALCGGCTFQTWTYDAQLAHLREVVRSLLGQVGLSVPVPPVLGMPAPFAYRNKMEFTFSDMRWVEDHEPEGADRSFAVGMHLPGRFNRILDIHDCAIAPPFAIPVLNSIRELSRKLAIPPWSSEAHTGVLRHVAFRHGVNTGETLVNLVTSGRDPSGVRKLVAGVLERHEITTIVENITERASSVAIGDEEIIHHGSGYLQEKLLGRRFQISANSFFQTNTYQAEVLFEEFLKVAQPRPDERVYDVCCGGGILGLILAPHVEEVTGFEIVPSAIADAERNRELNQADNVKFVLGDVLETLPDSGEEGPDLMVLDPPRAGLHPKVLERIIRAAPGRVVYVSCNLKTAAPELGRFSEAGYELQSVQPVDLFPHTPHVECVLYLERVRGR